MPEKLKKPQYHADALEDRVRKIEIDTAVEAGVHKWVRTVCITATSTFMGFCVWLGGFIYDKSEAVEAAAKAFLEALKRNGQ